MKFNEKTIKFGVTALTGTNKAGHLKQDEKGYVDGLTLGALSSVNTRGEVYDVDETVLGLFSDSSSFMKQVKDGRAKGENGHPELMPGEDDEAFVCRFMKINEPRECAHHAAIYLGTPAAGAGGPKVMPIYGKTAPSGELGYVLQGAIDRPEENICFSVRGATLNENRGGMTFRYFRELIAFDKVNDPGLPDAKKWTSIALESEGRSLVDYSLVINPYTVEKSISEVATIHSRMVTNNLAAESGATLNMGDLLNMCGYQHNPDMNSARGWRGWVNQAVKDSRFNR